MKKILFITILLLSSLTAMAQENVATRHIFKIGAYKFVCTDYDEEKGGGYYYLENWCDYSSDEIEILRILIRKNRLKLEEKCNKYIRCTMWLSKFGSADGPFVELYNRQAYDEYLKRCEAESLRRKMEQEERLKSLYQLVTE